MILVDTSVWIDYFNGHNSEQTDGLDRALITETVAIGDLIMLEILQGFRSDKDYEQVKGLLSNLERYQMFNHHMVTPCAENYRALRKKGITVRKTADVIIATFCIENYLPLLFCDKDFDPFVDHLGLTPVSNIF